MSRKFLFGKYTVVLFTERKRIAVDSESVYDLEILYTDSGAVADILTPAQKNVLSMLLEEGGRINNVGTVKFIYQSYSKIMSSIKKEIGAEFFPKRQATGTLSIHGYKEITDETLCEPDTLTPAYDDSIQVETDLRTNSIEEAGDDSLLNSDDLTHDSEVENVSTLSKSYIVRKEMVCNATGKVYLVGTTLKDAFSTSAENSDSSILDDLFSNSNIKELNVFLLNYLYVDVNQEGASRDIETSLMNLLAKAKSTINGGRDCPKINIVLLNDFDIPFALLTAEKLLTRSTHLFTKKRNFRGQYLSFGCLTEEYSSFKCYLEFLLEKAYDIDLNSKKESIYKVKSLIKGSNGLRRYVRYRKIHPTQLENLVRASFIMDPDRGKDNNDLAAYIPNPDPTQEVLLPYLRETECLFEKVIQQHDKSGWAKIIPAPDLGFPNDILRIAGGFLTGALYDWNCSVPIIPIDATVNTCTSSVFQLESFDAEMTEKQFIQIVEDLSKEANDNGYALNFKSGNHFFTLSIDDDGIYYVVLHSSAKQSKESCFGLYPSKQAWFKLNIKTEYNTDNSRYLRYIRGDAAVRFYDYAVRFREFNEEIHSEVAKMFAQKCGVRLSDNIRIIKHHYGMPTANSIAIGTFVVDVEESSQNRVFPIFSDNNKPICLYNVELEQSTTYNPWGTNSRIVLVPHGWGQVIDGVDGLHITSVDNEKKRKLFIESSEFCCGGYTVSPPDPIKLEQKHVRNFESMEKFLKNHCSHINGSIVKVLYPVFSYCGKK